MSSETRSVCACGYTRLDYKSYLDDDGLITYRIPSTVYGKAPEHIEHVRVCECYIPHLDDSSFITQYLAHLKDGCTHDGPNCMGSDTVVRSVP